MKILILQDDFPPESFGGAGQVAFDLAKQFQKLGHQVFVITTVQDKIKAGQINYQGLELFRLYANFHERWRAYLSLYNPQTVSQIKKLIQQIKPDLVHIHNIHFYLSYYSLKIAKKYSPAVFLTAHDAMLFHYGKFIEFINFNNLSVPQEFNYQLNFKQIIKRFKKRYNPLRNIFIRHYLKYLDKIFAVSQSLKQALMANGIRKVEVIYNGIINNSWPKDDSLINKFKKKHQLGNKKVIFFGGRLGPAKGGQVIIQSLAIVKKQIPEVILLIASQKDSYAQKMKNLAQKLNLGPNLIFLGWLEKQQLKTALHTSDLVVTPSLCLDTFNLINLEAMIAKKPVVGTCFGGTPEIIKDGETGYIVNPLDIKMTAEKIIELLKNPQKAERFGERGYERAKEKFTIEKQASEILKWYKKYASGK